jgi:hypothetical protein
MKASDKSSRDPSVLHPELLKRMELLFMAYRTRYPDAKQPFLSQTVRSYGDQSRDFAIGRTTGTKGKFVTQAKPGQSLHNYIPALAFDVFFKNADGSACWDEELYSNLGHLASSVGLEWGGTWKHKDTPHFQPPNYTYEMASKNIEPTFPDLQV